MTVAPGLFDGQHALGALKLADEILRGPLGMATLDPSDMQYRPYYGNSNDGTDAAIAKGLNYHNVSHNDSTFTRSLILAAGTGVGLASGLLLARLPIFRRASR